LLLKRAIDYLFFVRLLSLLLLCTFGIESQSLAVEPKRTFTHQQAVYYPVWNEVPRWEAGEVDPIGWTKNRPFLDGAAG
jgi:hypothetical protein